MLIADHIYDLLPDDLFLRVRGLGELTRFYLKIEGFNAGGSIKLKTARALVQAAEDSGVDLTRTHFIESTSGNLGVALAVICSAKRYRLTCVVDPNANATTVSLMQALGAEVVTVRERDAHGGFLGTRITYIQRRLVGEPGLYWLNQYTNPGNPTAHERSTAPAVLAAFGRVDYLVVGVGTSGTLMGCVDYFRRWSPQ
ncbi:MAG: pyridoxal-phosphate dependent enzyme, partial [Actinomycetota bacterium]|nr:pyridoxal-phosphate dependent enzyme [Actinomycetota bacterium]